MGEAERTVSLVASDGTNVRATLCDTGRAASPLLLMFHGISTNRDEYLGFFVDVAQRLRERGIRSLRIDFRGHGESPVTPSEFTIGSQIIDAVCALEFALGLDEVSQVSAFGCSFGAAPCLHLASLYPGIIRKVTLLAPVLDYRRVFLEPETDWGRDNFSAGALSACLKQGVSIPLSDAFQVGPRLLSSMLHAQNAEAIQHQANVTIVHGIRDGIVPIDISRKFKARLPATELIEIDNMEHGFTDWGDETGTTDATRKNVDRIISALAGGMS